MLDTQHTLTSDLEWMLQSGQASQEMLLEALAHEYYAPVYRFANGWFDDPLKAQDVARRTLAEATLDVHSYRSTVGVTPWVYRQALKACKREARAARQTVPAPLVNQDGIMIADAQHDLWQAFKSLPENQRQLILLQECAGLSMQDIAAALRKAEGRVSVELEAAWGSLEAWNADQDTADPTDVRQRLAYSLSVHCTDPGFSPTELNEEIAWVQAHTGRHGLRRQAAARWKELIVIGLAVGLALLAFWGFSQLTVGADGGEITVSSGPTPTPRSAAVYLPQSGESPSEIAAWAGVPVEALEPSAYPEIGSSSDGSAGMVIPLEIATPLTTTLTTDVDQPEQASLSLRSDSEAIRAMMVASPEYWRTLWLEAQVLDYGPDGYIGPPASSRYQAWIAQPDRSLEIIGQVGGRVDKIYLVTGDRSYEDDRLDFRLTRRASDDQLLRSRVVRWLAYPGTGPWLKQPGSFIPVERERLAGRSALVVDWRDQFGQRQYRLWLDVDSGVLLRLQQFGGPDFQALLSDRIVTQIRYDAELANELFDPRTAGQTGFAIDENGQPARFAPELAVELEFRQPLESRTPPANLDRANSRLVFQFPADLDSAALTSTQTDLSAELFAGGYSLGSVPFDLPWSLTCARSPDGARLVYAPLGRTDTEGNLHWFNLSEPGLVYTPLPAFQAGSLAFSPDGRRLAAAGAGALAENPPGVYLVDLATQEKQMLFEIHSAHSLIWNPEGSRVAFIGTVDPRSSDEEVIVVNVNTGQVVFQAPFTPDAPADPQWPMAEWGVDFPLDENPYACVEPPG